MKQILEPFWWQVFNLCLIPNRWGEYSRILQSAKAKGYTFLRLDELAEMQKQKTALPHPFIVLRHDIDTDCRAALQFSRREAMLGIQATYFFRQRTWVPKYIRKIASEGHETGYHFEELASFAKQRHIKSAQALEARKEEIKALLSANLQHLQQDVPIHSLASHGDFANRKLGLTNCPIASDKDWRSSMGISYEAYDPWLVEAYINHVSDRPFPQRYFPHAPQSYIAAKHSFLFLSHPRWWQNNPLANCKELFFRIKDQLLW